MSEAQLTQYKIIEKKIKPFAEKAKERRNEDYFGHLDQLNDDYLEVKLADRLHNLRDMSGVTKEKAIRKIAETEKYFLAVTEKRKPEIHKLLMIEIDRLKKEFGIAE
jgi:(p)ppGpp synthase/HD superfamily hydrolase